MNKIVKVTVDNGITKKTYCIAEAEVDKFKKYMYRVYAPSVKVIFEYKGTTASRPNNYKPWMNK